MPSREELAHLHPLALKALGGTGTRKECVRKALEIGEFSEAQRRVPSPAKNKYYETKLEYDLNHALTIAERMGLISHPGYDRWALPGTASGPI